MVKTWRTFKVKMQAPSTVSQITVHFGLNSLILHSVFASLTKTYSFLDSASCASSEAIFKLSEFSVFVVASIVSFNFFSDATFSLINVNDVSLVTFAFGAEITVSQMDQK